MMPNGYSIIYKTDSKGNTTIQQTVCDGEISIGPFKTCLKEFNTASAIGLILTVVVIVIIQNWRRK